MVLICQWALCLLLVLSPIRVMADTPTEYELKLAYLFNFTKYVNWPESAFESPDSPVYLCILGDIGHTPMATELTDKQSRRPVVFQHLTTYTTQSRCHILFVSRSVSAAHWHTIATSITSPTLIVGETRNFARTSGAIGFVLDEKNRIRLEINLAHARQQQLSIRAQLLEIARVIYRDEERS